MLPGGHSLLVTRARSLAFGRGRPGDRGRRPAGLPARLRRIRPGGRPGRSSTWPTPRRHRDARARWPASAAGDLSPVLHRPRPTRAAPRPWATWSGWPGCGGRRARRRPRTPRCWRARPTRSTRCASTANCCAGSTTTRSSSATAATSSRSPAGYVEPAFPGRWLDPGPYGCLGTGLGYAIAARLAYPSSQVVLLLGDGAAGLFADGRGHAGPPQPAGGHDRRQQLGTGAWRRTRCGRSTATTWPPTCARAALRRSGERARRRGRDWSTKPGELGPALRRAFDSGGPYLVNVITDVAAEYPRTTTGV